MWNRVLNTNPIGGVETENSQVLFKKYSINVSSGVKLLMNVIKMHILIAHSREKHCASSQLFMRRV